MITLPKEIMPHIKKHKKLVRKHRREEDKEFKAICRWLEIDPNGLHGDALFEYIYNDTRWAVKFA